MNFQLKLEGKASGAMMAKVAGKEERTQNK
jgi:hypothetical protein